MDKILITTSSFGKHVPSPAKTIEQAGFQVVLNPYGRKLTEKEVFELIDKTRPVGMIAGVEPLTRRVLQHAKKLKVVSRCGIGLDSVDLEAARELGIAVTNTPDAPTIPVAELTLGMMLALLRKVHISDASIRAGGWGRPMGNLLHGKTVGLIGCGRIGSYVARLLSSFACEVLGFDPACLESEHFCLVEVDRLIAEADIVCLHIPYSEQTHHFIDKERIRAMKKGAVLINTARGGLVDEEALMIALQSGHLSGAALDCFENEPYTGPLKELDNVLLTAHIGSYAREGRTKMEQQAVENLLLGLRQNEGRG